MAGVTVTGGDRWKPLFNSLVKAAQGSTLEIGLLEGRGGGYTERGISAATLGFWHEFGTSRTPPRPFLRKALAEKGQEWSDTATAYIKAHSAGLINAPAGMVEGCYLAVGRNAERDVKRLFSSGQIAPAVTPRREAKKAESFPESVGHPLVYSGNLSQAVAFEIKRS